MATVAELLVKIGANSSGLRKELAATQRQIKRAFGPEALAFSKKATNLLGGLAVAMGAVGVASVSLAGKLRMTQVALESLLNSSDAAKQMIKDLRHLDDISAFDFDTYAKGAQKMIALGIAADQVIPMLTTIGDASAALGQGKEGIDRITLAFSQIISKGKAAAQELNQLAENNVRAREYLADALGYAADDPERIAKVMDLAEKSMINGRAAVAVIIEGMKKDYEGTMDKMADETPIAWNTIVSSASQSLTSLGSIIDKAFGVNKALVAFRDYMVDLKGKLDEMKESGASLNEVLQKIVPPEVATSIVVLAGAITGAAIPALKSMAIHAALALKPLAPWIITGAAVAAAIWLLWKPISKFVDWAKQFEIVCWAAKTAMVGLSIGLTATFGPAILASASALISSAIPALTGFATAAWTAIAPLLPFAGYAAAVAAIAYVVVKAWKPLGELFKGLWLGIYSTAKYYWAGIETVIFGVLAGIFNSIDWIFKKLNITNPLSGITKSINGELNQSIDNMNQAWADMGKSVTQMGGALVDTWNTVTKSVKKTVKDVSDIVKPKKAGTTTKTDTATNTTTPLLQAGKGTEKAAKAFEKLQNKAKQLSESIEREWVQTTKTDREQLDIWLTEQLAALDVSKTANENYQKDVDRVKAVYAVRSKKLDEEEHQRDLDKINRMRDLKRAAEDMLTKNKTDAGGIGLKGVDKELYDLTTGYNDALTQIDRDYADLQNKFKNGTADEKDEMIKTWTETGLAFKTNADGTVSFAEQAAAERLTVEKQYNADVMALDYARTKYKEQLDDAYKDGNIKKYIELLNTQQGLDAAKLEGKKAMLDEYYAIWQETHRTAMSYMAEISAGAREQLGDAFASIINGAATAGEAWQKFKNSFLSMIGQMVAKRLAAMAMELAFGKSMETTMAAASVTTAATTAAAWAPAAAAVSLASFGANATPAMTGMSSTYALSATLSAVPGLAEGGITTGPTLAEIGEGKYREAVLPLNKRYFEKVGLTADKEKQPISFSPTVQLQFLDTKDADRWLENGGGAKIEKYLRNAHREFAFTGV